jgi:hypothetical protein
MGKEKGGRVMSSDFKLEELNFEERDVRQTFIKNTTSGMYGGKDVDGREVLVMVQQGEGMSVRYLNSKGWYEGYNYDSKGFRESEILEKARD